MTIRSAARRIALKIRLISTPARVSLQGTKVPAVSQSDFETAPLGWRHDVAEGFLEIKLQHFGGTNEISF
jgi:hypothetical protein